MSEEPTNAAEIQPAIPAQAHPIAATLETIAYAPVQPPNLRPRSIVIGSLSLLLASAEFLFHGIIGIAAFEVGGFARHPAIALLLASVAEMGLALLLFVAATLLLAGRQKGASLHRIYAWLQIPLALSACGAMLWLEYTLFRRPFSTQWKLIAITAIPPIVGLAYPMLLLALFPARRPRGD